MQAHFHEQRSRVLQLLRRRGAAGATTADVSDPIVGGHEGPRRVRELRELGYPVLARPLPNGYWRYWLRQPGEIVVRQDSLFEEE